eukprot:1159139-Pelagomonas_calceolata.AAC.10
MLQAPKSMLDSAEIEREVSDIIAQGGSGGLAPPKLDRSESLLSPAAAKHLARCAQCMSIQMHLCWHTCL